MRDGRSFRMFSGVMPPRRRHQPAENHARDPTAKLLIDNGLDQGFEIRIAKLDTIVANPFDDLR